jgi:disulfide bond formation protein DsbB
VKQRNDDNQAAWLLVFTSCILALVATLGSLFFSEVMAIPVCKLCWYQRLALYPLVVILAFGLFPFEPRMLRTAAVFVACGWLIGLFQLLVIAGLIPENLQPCVQGIPCSDTHIALFGFLNIPTLSFLTFSFIGALLYFAHRTESA